MWIVVTVLLVVVLYPQLWIVLGSFKTQSEFLSNPTWSLPESLNLDNYIQALDQRQRRGQLPQQHPRDAPVGRR